MRTPLVLSLMLLSLGCVSQDSDRAKTPAAAQESNPQWGICYDTQGCRTGSETWFDVSQSQCRIERGSSWQGRDDSCVNF